MLNTKNFLINICPKQLRLPLTFYYWKFLGKLEKEIFFLKDLVGNGKTTIDIGANNGIYSYALSKLCERVEAFEPQPWCSEIISAYSQSSGNKIHVHNVGLSDSEGSLTLHVPLIRGRLHTGLASFKEVEGACKCETVPIYKLDDYNFKDVSLIKIDVEGYESQVIKGSKETILREKPVLLVEIEQRHLGNKPIESVFNEITELGYKGSFLYKGKFLSLSEFSSERYQKQSLEDYNNKYFDSKVNQEYVNNFIFRPV
jgi:FkbM family methyltransferase